MINELLDCTLSSKNYKIKSLSIDKIDYVSFINLVNYYKEELILLMKIKEAKDIFTNGERENLIKKFVIISGSRSKGRFCYPSCLTRMILSGLIEVDAENLEIK